jgi:hypothetical protein
MRLSKLEFSFVTGLDSLRSNERWNDLANRVGRFYGDPNGEYYLQWASTFGHMTPMVQQIGAPDGEAGNSGAIVAVIHFGDIAKPRHEWDY